MAVRRQRAGAVLPVLLLVALPWVFLWPLWWGDAASRRYLPEGDFSSQYYPLRAYAARRLARGELPLWNPYALAGQPGMADIQAGTLYPPQSLQSLALGGDLSYLALEAQVPLHLALAGVGAYLFALRLTRSRWGGLAAGLAYSLGGYLTSFPVQQLTILCTASWLPWLLLAVERLAADPRRLGAATAAVAVPCALTVLAGHPQTALLVGYLVAAYAVWRAWRLPQRWPFLAQAAAGAALGLGLAAVQLLPTLEFIAHSTRSSLGLDAVSGGFGLHEIAAVLYPGYLGGTPQYAGAAALVLAAIAVVAVPWRRTAFWVVSAAAGLLLSFGGSTALYYLAYILLPGFGASRNQERAVLLLAFSLTVLAAYGVAALAPERRTESATPRRLWLATLAAVALGVALYAGTHLPPPASGINLFGGILKQHLWVVLAVALPAALLSLRGRGLVPGRVVPAAMVALVGLNLYVVNASYNPGEAPAAVSRPSAAAAAHVSATLAPGQRLASGGLLAEGPSAGMLYGLPDTSGNTPLQLESYSRFVATVPEWRRWQLLAVACVVLPADATPAAGLEPDTGGQERLYRVAEPADPARLVHSAVSATGDGVWAALADPGYDPATQAVVSAGLDGLAPAAGPESVRVVAWQPERVDLEVEATSAGLLVISQVAYPGWATTVDATATATLTADGLFVGLPIDAGRHAISLRYRPASARAGATITALAALAAVLLAGRRKVPTTCPDDS